MGEALPAQGRPSPVGIPRRPNSSFGASCDSLEVDTGRHLADADWRPGRRVASASMWRALAIVVLGVGLCACAGDDASSVARRATTTTAPTSLPEELPTVSVPRDSVCTDLDAAAAAGEAEGLDLVAAVVERLTVGAPESVQLRDRANVLLGYVSGACPEHEPLVTQYMATVSE